MAVEERTTDADARLIRAACQKLGADDEMVALVLASYHRRPEALEAHRAAGGDLLAYVQDRLARWEAIFLES